MKLLVIDDEDGVRNLLRELLQSERSQVLAAATIQEAAAQLSDSEPDMIILDRNLPDGDGLDFCRWLRSNAHWSKIPVLVISSLKSFEDVAAGIDAGGTHYMAKPFALDELNAAIGRLFEAKRQALPPAGFAEVGAA